MDPVTDLTVDAYDEWIDAIQIVQSLKNIEATLTHMEEVLDHIEATLTHMEEVLDR